MSLVTHSVTSRANERAYSGVDLCSKAAATIEQRRTEAHSESVLALFLASNVCNEYNLLTQFRAIFVCVLPFFTFQRLNLIILLRLALGSGALYIVHCTAYTLYGPVSVDELR